MSLAYSSFSVACTGPHVCPQTMAPQATLSCLSVACTGPMSVRRPWPSRPPCPVYQLLVPVVSVVWPEVTLSSLSSLSVYCLTPSVPFLPATPACSYWHTCPDFLLTATCPDFLSTCMPCLYVCPVPCLPPAIYLLASLPYLLECLQCLFISSVLHALASQSACPA